MGLKMLASNEHSSLAAVLPSAAWTLVWALGSIKNEKDGIFVDGLKENGNDCVNFTEMKIGYTGKGDMTILPAEAYCNISVKLSEGQNAADVCSIIRSHLTANGFGSVNVTLM